MTAGWRDHLDGHQDRILADAIELLRIPSVSALPEHAGDVRRAAEWVAARLSAAGLEHARLLPTPRHPIVYADWLHAPGQPTVLLYAHCDVQPVDPLAEWRTPPFEPTIRDGRLYARGAADMKCGLVSLIAAVDAHLRTSGRLPINVKFFVEGEEEIGSPSAPALLADERELFACDVVLSGDGQQLGEDRPCARVAWRGGVGFQVDVRGANADLHSGHYGGIAPNAPLALAQLLASMKAPDGRVLVDGFYDDVRPLTDADKAEIAAAAMDEVEVKRRLDLDELVGEPGFTPAERVAARPTLEVVGMWGGYQGEGSKSVIPSEAHAKISCRLVADQDPERVRSLLEAHATGHVPPGVRVSVRATRSRGTHPYHVPADHPGNRAVVGALREAFGREPVYLRNGGSLPVTTIFREQLGAYTVALGFSLTDQRTHAPNEFQRLAMFRRGQAAHARFLELLALEAS